MSLRCFALLCVALRFAAACTLAQAKHPVFFYWVEDATAEMDSFRNDGYKCSHVLLPDKTGPVLDLTHGRGTF